MDRLRNLFAGLLLTLALACFVVFAVGVGLIVVGVASEVIPPIVKFLIALVPLLVASACVVALFGVVAFLLERVEQATCKHPMHDRMGNYCKSCRQFVNHKESDRQHRDAAQPPG